MFGSTPDNEEVLADWKVFNVLCVQNNDNLVVKVCLPVDRHIMAIVVKRDMRCRERLVTFLETDEATLQPYTLVDDNMKAPDALKHWVDIVKAMRNRLQGIYKSTEKDLGYNTDSEAAKPKTKPKKNEPTVTILLPGSSKSIRVVAQK